MKITNIANDRFKGGYFYSSENYHPETCHLPVEPWIAGQHLRLDSEIVVSDDYYFTDKDNLEDYKRHKIIDFITPIYKEKVVVEPLTIQPKPVEKVLSLDDEFVENLTKFVETTSQFTQLVISAIPQVEGIVEEASKEDVEQEPVEDTIETAPLEVETEVVTNIVPEVVKEPEVIKEVKIEPKLIARPPIKSPIKKGKR